MPRTEVKPDDGPIESVAVHSAAELKTELEALGQLLSGTTAPWTARTEGLRRIQGLVRGGAVNFPNFLQLARDHLREGFSTQLKDLRSAVARETCHAIQCLCEYCGTAQWEQMSDWWLPALFKATFVTIAVVAEASNLALRFIVLSGKLNPRAMTCIFANTQNKHNICRIRANEYVLLLLQSSSPVFLAKYLDQFEGTIRCGVTDSIAEVRHSSRLAWWAYKTHFPDRAERLLVSFDQAVQKNIQEDFDAFNKLETAVNQTSHVPTSPTANRTTGVSSAHTRRLLSSSPRAGAPAPKPKSTRTHSVGAIGHVPKPPKLSATIPPPDFDEVEEEEEECTLGEDDSLLSPQLADMLPPPDMTEMETGGSPTTSVSPTAVKPLLPVAPDPIAPTVIATPATPTASPTNVAPYITLLQQAPPTAVESPAPSSGLFRAPSPMSPAFTAYQPEDENNRPRSLPRAKPRQPQPEELLEVAWADHPLWSTKLKFCTTLQSLLQKNAEVNISADKLFAIVTEKLGDAHYKVVTAAIELVPLLSDSFPSEAEPHLERLFVRLFTRQADPKAQVKAAAQQAVEHLSRSRPLAQLVPVLLRVLDNTQIKLRQTTIAHLMALLKGNPEYTSNPAAMRMVVNKLVQLAQCSSPEAEKSCLAALGTLHGLQPDAFATHVAALAPQEQVYIRDHLGIPDERRRAIAKKAPSIKPEDMSTPISEPVSEAVQPSRGWVHVPREPERPIEQNERVVEVEQFPSRNFVIEPLRDHSPGLMPTMYKIVPASSSAPEYRVVVDTPLTRPTATTLQTNFATTVEAPTKPAHPLTNGQAPALQPTLAAMRPTTPDPFRSAYATIPLLQSDGKPVSVRALIETISRSDGEGKREALQKLLAFLSPATHHNVQIGAFHWEQDFEHLIRPTLECTKSPESVVRSLAVLLVKNLVVHRTAQCLLHTSQIMQHLMDCVVDQYKEVSQNADEALNEAVTHLDPQRLTAFLVQEVNLPAHPMVQVPIRLIGKLAARLPNTALLERVPEFINALYEGFKHRNADVRKAVVFCLVDLYMRLREEFNPWLQPLNTSQLKLVTIYINRQQQLREDAPLQGMPPPASFT